MDLEKMQSKLEDGIYSESKELFFNDLFLIVDDALDFFRPNSLEYEAASKLHNFVTKEISKTTDPRGNEQCPPPPPPPRRPRGRPRKLSRSSEKSHVETSRVSSRSRNTARDASNDRKRSISSSKRSSSSPHGGRELPSRSSIDRINTHDEGSITDEEVEENRKSRRQRSPRQRSPSRRIYNSKERYETRGERRGYSRGHDGRSDRGESQRRSERGRRQSLEGTSRGRTTSRRRSAAWSPSPEPRDPRERREEGGNERNKVTGRRPVGRPRKR